MDFIHRRVDSASRDGSLRIFRLPRETSEEECAVCASPVVSIEPTRGGCGSRSSEKLRGVKLVYDAPSPQLATISSSGTVYQLTRRRLTSSVKSTNYEASPRPVRGDRRTSRRRRLAPHIGLIDFRMRGAVTSFAVHSTRRRSLSFGDEKSFVCSTRIHPHHRRRARECRLF